MRPFDLVLPSLVTTLLLCPPAHAGESFVFKLDASQTVPRVLSDASGSCVAVLNDAGTRLTLNCTHNVEHPIASHIHVARRGLAGPIVFPFDDPTSPINATWDLEPEDRAQLLAGNLYVNVHSQEDPGGEIRGQIAEEPDFTGVTTFVPLSGDQQVPNPLTTGAEGRCRLKVNQELTTAEVTCVHNVANAIAAHIHRAPRGENGPIVVDFGGGQSPIFVTIDLTAPENEDLLQDAADGNLYVNVHSMAFPNGEIRGQIDACASTDEVLCLGQGRFEVEVRFQPVGEEPRNAIAVPESADSGMFWFFTPDNVEMLIKVLNACPVNNHFWVFLAATTNVEFEVEVTDTLTGDSKTYVNPQSTDAETVLDTSAFSTCP